MLSAADFSFLFDGRPGQRNGSAAVSEPSTTRRAEVC